MTKTYTPQRILQLYGSCATKSAVLAAEKAGYIPGSERVQTGSISRRIWPLASMPQIGKRFGFLGKPASPLCIAVYSAKGGVFKTSLAINISRLAALHGLRTCVIGLDFQSDITQLFGITTEYEVDIGAIINKIEQTRGLLNLFDGSGTRLEDVVCATELPTLDVIPETGGLITLERALTTKDRREYKLREVVVDRLRERYDLIVIDCAPSWSNLITNALVACDVLLSPIECRGSQFNSLSVFRAHLAEFTQTMRLSFKHLYIPTRYSPNRRLSAEIRSWYSNHLENVSLGMIRDSTVGEEAISAGLSLPEYDPASPFSHEMRELMREIWRLFETDAMQLKAAS